MKDDAINIGKVTPSFSSDGDDSEIRLLEGLRRGDADAFESVVRQYAGRLLPIGRRVLGDQALAEDALQETFMKVLEKINDYEERGTFSGWLRRIMLNQSLMKLRARKRKEEQSIDDLLPEFDGNNCRIEEPWTVLKTPEEICGSAEASALVQSKISELPETHRIVLLLRDIEELTTAETAEILEISESAVKVRLHRARSALKSLLEPILRGELP